MLYFRPLVIISPSSYNIYVISGVPQEDVGGAARQDVLQRLRLIIYVLSLLVSSLL